MIIGLHHLGIVVTDIQKAVEFYCELLEYSVSMEMEWQAPHSTFDQITGLTDSAAKIALLKGKNSYLEIFEFTSGNSKSRPQQNNADDFGIRHLGFEVDNVQEMFEKLLKLGGKKINEPASMKGGGTGVYCRDPFGNIIEFTSAAGKFPSLREL